jgi:hypothetical protein
VAILEQALRVFLVDGEAFGLPIWAVRSSDVRSFIPGEAKPVERGVDTPLGIRIIPILIRILDAEDELAALLASEGVVEEGLIRSADMRVTGGTWR